MISSPVFRIFLSLTALAVSQVNLLAQAYFEGNVYRSADKKKLNNVKIMVINNLDTSYFKVESDGTYNITTREGRNRIYAISDGYVTELNSINAAKGSKNKVDISLTEADRVKTGHVSRAEAPPAGTAAYRWDFGDGDGIREADGDGSAGLYKAMRARGAESISGSYSLAGSANTTTAGRLSAGEINDFAKWNLWNDLADKDFLSYSSVWRAHFRQRYSVQLKNRKGNPIVDAAIELVRGGEVLWQARTDNSGIAELWAHAYDTGVVSRKPSEENLSIRVSCYGVEKIFNNPSVFSNGLNFYIIDGPCSISDQLDIAFVVDATGSMGDEIAYLKYDLDTLIKQISGENQHINLRMASVFYRDHGDEYVTRISPFSSNTNITDNFIAAQYAAGGGDFPEAVDMGMEAAVSQLEWSSSARARILFLLLDAPGHEDVMMVERLNKYTRMAAAKGIRIVPVGCSGINKSTEFMLRSMALATNGKYTFLTNHSGIGYGHIEPSTDVYKVESLLSLLVRTAREYSLVADCDQQITLAKVNHIDTLKKSENPLGPQDSAVLRLAVKDSIPGRDSAAFAKNNTKDSSRSEVLLLKIGIRFYPNPSSGKLTVDVKEDIREFYLADISGKLLQRFTCASGESIQLDLSAYASGVYYIKYPAQKGWVAERIVLVY